MHDTSAQTDSASPRAILFTAFEPSGDAHASSVIAALKAQAPEVPVYAWGGPAMERAGATIVQRTSTDGAMGAGGLSKILEHIRITRDLKRWVHRHPEIAVHVPVDSPAANFPICRITKRAGCRVVHLVAPQLWAWAPWRIGKLRRLTDLVLCLLPFEEPYFLNRNVSAKFIGHPVIAAHLDSAAPAVQSGPTCDLPHPGGPRIALLPGSRSGEINRHAGDMAAIVHRLAASHPKTSAVFVATNHESARRIESQIRRVTGDGGSGSCTLSVTVGSLSTVLSWADLVLVCSGTATLDVACHGVPMVVMYKLNPLSWNLVGRWLLTTRFIALPNIIADRQIVPEIIPYHRSLDRITSEAALLLDNPGLVEAQLENLSDIIRLFRNHDPGRLAAQHILNQLNRAV